MSFLDSQLLMQAEEALKSVFNDVDRISRINQYKVLKAFWNNKVSEPMLHGTTGYGYDDKGRDTLDKVFAEAFGAEDALVRHNFVSGTHVLSTVLYALLRPGQTLFSISGKPYDTLSETIGLTGSTGNGSLADFGIKYQECELLSTGDFDKNKIKDILEKDETIKLIFIQRSRGYTQRPTIPVDKIGEICRYIKSIRNIPVFVDNCYGEFAAENEPVEVGADLMAGSLIKNPGGGLAETGAYIAGRADLIELCAYRLTAVGIGKECGATLNQLKSMYQGFFMAPHITAQAKKTAILAAYLFEQEGFEVSPLPFDPREDIIQTVTFHDKNKLIQFCEGIQAAAPIDSYVTPEPWAMPGYQDEVIMAAGSFVSGASIELSADAPIKPPYTAYFQGGLTYESGSIAILTTINRMRDKK